MSFMEGFGNAFSQSFQRSFDRASAQRDDIFKMNYASYLDGAKERRKADAAAREEIKQAKQMTKWANAPEEAWPTVLSWMQAGATLKDIDAKVKGGSWNKNSESSATPDSAQQTTSMLASPAANLVDPRQEIEASQQKAQTQAAPTPKGNMMQGLLGAASGVFKNMSREGMTNSSVQKIAEQEGQTVEQVRDTMAGVPTSQQTFQSPYSFVPGTSTDEFSAFKNIGEAAQSVQYWKDQLAKDPENENAKRNLDSSQSALNALQSAKDIETNIVAGAEAKAQAEYYTVQDASGRNRIVNASQLDSLSPEEQNSAKLMSPNQAKRVNEVVDKAGPEIKTLRNKVISYEGSLASIDTIEALTRADNTLLTEWLNKANQSGSNFAEGAKNMYQTVRDYTGVVDGEDSFASASDKLRSFIGSAAQQLSSVTDEAQRKAIAGRIIDAQMTLLTYDIATLQGQDGRNLAEAERKVFADIMKGGATVDGFMANAANILAREVDKLDSSFRSIKEDPSIKGLGADVDWLPTDSVEELLERSGKKASHENLMKYRVGSSGLSDVLKKENKVQKVESKVREGMGSPKSLPKDYDVSKAPPLRKDSPAGVYKVGKEILYYDGKNPDDLASFSPVR